MNQVIIVLNALSASAGGLTRVALSRCDAFNARGIKSFVALTNFDSKLLSTFEAMREEGRISATVNVVNFYAYYAYISELMIKNNSSAVEDKIVINNIVKTKITRKVNVVKNTDLKIVRYYTSSGHLFLQELIQDKNECLWISISVPNEIPLEFDCRDEAHSHWLGELGNRNLPTAIIADSPPTCDTVMNVLGKDIYKILTIHNNHFKYPYKPGAVLNDRYAKVLNGLPVADALVVLTAKQSEHIKFQFRDRGNIFVIGNPLTKFNPVEDVVRDNKLAVAVCRLHSMKNLEQILINFSEVVKNISDAKLEIWGTGVEEEMLREKINHLNMNDSIFLKGYTTDAATVFSRASVSLAASHFEGFGVSFAESLSLGTPVVSFKTLYGPEEIITNEEDGFLVDSNEEFIIRVNELLSSPSLVKSMAANGSRNMEKFSHQNISNKWLEMFEALEQRGSKEHCAVDPAYGDFVERKVNVSGSAFGWLYFASNTKMDVDDLKSKFTSVRLIKVRQERGFKGEQTELFEGDYTVDSLQFVEERQEYRFRVKKNDQIYTKGIGNNAINFIFDLN